MRRLIKWPIGLETVDCYGDKHIVDKEEIVVNSSFQDRPTGGMQNIFCMMPAEPSNEYDNQYLAITVLGVIATLKAKGLSYPMFLTLVQEAMYQCIPEVKEYFE